VDGLGATVYEFAAMIALPFLDGVGKIHAYKEGRFKSVPCFTMVDSDSIGADMGRDPAEGTPRVVNVEDVPKYSTAADRKL
jgi:adenine phosphoribosyltransferase